MKNDFGSYVRTLLADLAKPRSYQETVLRILKDDSVERVSIWGNPAPSLKEEAALWDFYSDARLRDFGKLVHLGPGEKLPPFPKPRRRSRFYERQALRRASA